jgi:hypothetical protein
VSAPPRIDLEEARQRLRELGYLKGPVERYFFRRALEGRGAPMLPAVLLAAAAGAIASVAAVEVSEAGFRGSPGAALLLWAHLFAACLAPAAILGWIAGRLADRSRTPGVASAAIGFLSAAAVCLLFLLGARSLGGRLEGGAILWAVPAGAAAFLAGVAARSAFLARAYARTRIVPERRLGRAAVLVALLGSLAAGVLLFPRRDSGESPPPPLPAPRRESLVVVAVDGLSLDDPAAGGSGVPLRELLEEGATGWWTASRESPPEIWMDLATGLPAERHGVRALARVRPAGSPLGLRPPVGTRWYLQRLGPPLGLVSSEPVSAADRRGLTFWEVAASAGLPSAAVGWWASGPWPGAVVVDNRELLLRASDGREVDARAIAALESIPHRRLSTVYLPGADILRDDREARAGSLAVVTQFLRRQIARARSGESVLVVLAADSHPAPGALGRMVVFDGVSPRNVRIRPEDVTPSLLARAGIPVARDLPGRPAPGLFAAGSLETVTVATYGDRVAPARPEGRTSDREYLERLKSLGYLD